MKNRLSHGVSFCLVVQYYCFEELVSFFTQLKQKSLIITFYHVIGSDNCQQFFIPFLLLLLHVFKDLFPVTLL